MLSLDHTLGGINSRAEDDAAQSEQPDEATSQSSAVSNEGQPGQPDGTTGQSSADSDEGKPASPDGTTDQSSTGSNAGKSDEPAATEDQSSTGASTADVPTTIICNDEGVRMGWDRDGGVVVTQADDSSGNNGWLSQQNLTYTTDPDGLSLFTSPAADGIGLLRVAASVPPGASQL